MCFLGHLGSHQWSSRLTHWIDLSTTSDHILAEYRDAQTQEELPEIQTKKIYTTTKHTNLHAGEIDFTDLIQRSY